jgi:hypothetical protein
MSSRPALWPTQPSIQWLPRALSPAVKRPGREADHSSPSAEIKNGGAIPPFLIRLHDVVHNCFISRPFQFTIRSFPLQRCAICAVDNVVKSTNERTSLGTKSDTHSADMVQNER